MTCKDCIHGDVCQYKELPVIAEQCVDFKDKSKYIELPCKVNDTVYIIDPYYGICDMTLRDIRVNDLLKNNIFLTKEEAEQILKEFKDNE